MKVCRNMYLDTSRTLLIFKVILTCQGHMRMHEHVCTFTTSSRLFNFKVIGQTSRSRVFLCVFVCTRTRGDVLSLEQGLTISLILKECVASPFETPLSQSHRIVVSRLKTGFSECWARKNLSADKKFIFDDLSCLSEQRCNNSKILTLIVI